MKAKKNATTALVTLIVVVLAVIFIIPFFLVILNSFKTSVDFVANPFSLPGTLHGENYSNAFNTMNFLNSFKNSLIICVVATAVSVVLSSMNAYVLTRKKWKITKAFYMILVAAMVVPFQVIMIPLVKMYGSGLGLTNNIWLVTFLHIGLNIPSPTFLYSGFITGIPEELDEAVFSGYLDSAGIPDPELIIRPSGELRLSNFLLWQCAYSEFYVTDTLWPDFDEAELDRAITAYQGRDRRFGGVKK